MFNNRNDTLIAELQQQREAAIANFNQVAIIKNEELAEFFFSRFQTGQDVPYSLLIQMPEDEAIPLPVVHGGWIVTTRKHMEKADLILYDTKWSAGSTLTWHYHSDCNERLEIITGKVKVYSEGNINELLPGQTMEIGFGIGHQITALINSQLNITFRKIKTC